MVLASWVLAQPCVSSAERPAASYESSGTKRMAERLRVIAAASDPRKNTFLSAERANIFSQIAKAGTDPKEVLEFRTRYPIELLNSGRPEQSMKEFWELRGFLKDENLLELNKDLLRRYEVVAFLRLGEQENCLANHTIESCLFPIQGGGIHTLQRGSRGAITILNQWLAEAPSNLSARWWLNIASMTLGEYPGKVPAQWLIPPSVFESPYDIKRFHDISGNLGLDTDGLAGGAIIDDFDADGYLDVIHSSWGSLDPLHYYRNNRDGTFTDQSRVSGLAGVLGGLNLIQADYNNDGHLDFLVLRGAWFGAQGKIPNSLIRNNGDGTFDDVTEETGLLSFHPTQTAAWFDYNNDGWIDLFIGNESSGNDLNPCELFRNNRDGTFTECAAKSGLTFFGFVKGVASGDFNNDGSPDLYLSCNGTSNVLFRNDGARNDPKYPNEEWKFTDVSRRSRVQEPAYSFPTWFWDYDNDGWLDIFVSGYKLSDVGDIAADYLGLPHGAERARLFRNDGKGRFTDETESAGVFKLLHTMGCNYGDLDNDGFLDFYAGTGDPDFGTIIPNRMFRNSNGRNFQDVTTSGGFGHLQKGHGIAFADLDNDGDQDVYEDMGGAYSGDNYRNALYENPGHGNHWITLRLEGVQSNRMAIGARIKVTVATTDGERRIFRTVCSGGSFGASPLRQEIGLGQAESIKTIELFWPVSGKTQIFQNVAMDRFWKLREGDSALSPVELRTLAFSKGADGKSVYHHPEGH